MKKIFKGGLFLQLAIAMLTHNHFFSSNLLAEEQSQHEEPNAEGPVEEPDVTESVETKPTVSEESVSEVGSKPSGAVKIGITYSSLTSFNDLKSYDKFCGSPSGVVQFRANKEFLNVGIPLRLGISGGYYSDTCKTFKGNPDGDSSELIEAEGGKTALKIIPLQLNIATTLELPFTRFFNLDLWTGLEKAYFEETRTVSTSSEDSEATDSDQDASGQRLVLRGDRNSMVFGVSLNLLLSKLDEQSALSLYNSLGLGKIFLKVFAESTLQSSDDPNLSRLTMGLGFGFQTGKP